MHAGSSWASRRRRSRRCSVCNPRSGSFSGAGRCWTPPHPTVGSIANAVMVRSCRGSRRNPGCSHCWVQRNRGGPGGVSHRGDPGGGLVAALTRRRHSGEPPDVRRVTPHRAAASLALRPKRVAVGANGCLGEAVTEAIRPCNPQGAFGARHGHTRSTYTRQRIRHGIRHTAARAGRRPRPSVANDRLRNGPAPDMFLMTWALQNRVVVSI